LSLSNNLAHIQEKIETACKKANRPSESVQLIAVSKTFPVQDVQALAQIGHVDFAENRIAELNKKIPETQIYPSLRWHLIGTLQSNKIKDLPDALFLFHALDRLSLAEKLNAHMLQNDKSIQVLLQVNASREINKSGFRPEDLLSVYETAIRYPALKICGLMTMAENTTDAAKIGNTFREVFELNEKLKNQNLSPHYHGWLSMGMSHDFEIAIQEGATHIRIGSLLFGKRGI